MLEHQTPFDAVGESSDTASIEGLELRATDSGAGFLLLQSSAESGLPDALMSEIAMALPGPQATTVRGDYALLWMAPAEWLLKLPPGQTDSVQSALTRRLSATLVAVTDMSDAFACWKVSGPRAADALMSGCGLDLRAHAFPAGRVVRTALADIPAIIWRADEPPCLRCLVDRSFAMYFRDWLADMART